MIKDIFKSLNSIHKDSNLTLEEKHLLTILIKYHNVTDGYSYPTYEILLEECSTSRRSKISKMIKGLKEKAYIEVVKVKGNKSHYYIKKHLFFIEKFDSDKKENSTDETNLEKVVEEKVETKDNAIKAIIVSDCKESGLQMTIDDVEKVEIMTPEERKEHDQVNSDSVRIARKYTDVDGNGYSISILSCLDSQIVREAGYRFKNQLELGKLKLNCVSNFLRVVVDKYFEKGIDFPTKAFNMLKKYNYVTCQPSDAKLAMISEESEMYMQVEETSEEYFERINRELGFSDKIIGGTECVIEDMTEALQFNGIMIGANIVA